jgi:hypothetical protein
MATHPARRATGVRAVVHVANLENVMKLPLVIALVSLGLAGAGAAQTVPNPGACRTDAQKLCGTEMKTRDKSKVQACLVANAEKVTAPCRENLMVAKDAKAAK